MRDLFIRNGQPEKAFYGEGDPEDFERGDGDGIDYARGENGNGDYTPILGQRSLRHRGEHHLELNNA